MFHNLYNPYMLNESRLIIKFITSDNDTLYHDIVVPLEQSFRKAPGWAGRVWLLVASVLLLVFWQIWGAIEVANTLLIIVNSSIGNC